VKRRLGRRWEVRRVQTGLLDTERRNVYETTLGRYWTRYGADDKADLERSLEMTAAREACRILGIPTPDDGQLYAEACGAVQVIDRRTGERVA